MTNADPAALARRTNVVFDLGKVLIDWDPRYLFRKLLPSEEEVERFLTEVCTPGWYEEHDSERPLGEGAALLAEQRPEHADLIRAFDLRWAETLGDAHHDTVAVLDELRSSDAPLYALTNWPVDKFVHAEERFEFLAWFRGIVVSGREGVRKPDPQIFRILFERYDLVPAQSLFIDDVQGNVDVAATLGMRGIHFRSAAQLRRDLVRLDLLPG